MGPQYDSTASKPLLGVLPFRGHRQRLDRYDELLLLTSYSYFSCFLLDSSRILIASSYFIYISYLLHLSSYFLQLYRYDELDFEAYVKVMREVGLWLVDS